MLNTRNASTEKAGIDTCSKRSFDLSANNLACYSLLKKTREVIEDTFVRVVNVKKRPLWTISYVPYSAKREIRHFVGKLKVVWAYISFSLLFWVMSVMSQGHKMKRIVYNRIVDVKGVCCLLYFFLFFSKRGQILNRRFIRG